MFVRIIFIHDSTWFWVVNYLRNSGYISLLFLMHLLACARYFKKAFDCFASCSTLFEGHEFASDATHFISHSMRYIHCLCICLDVSFCAGVLFVMWMCPIHTTFHVWFIFTPMLLWHLCRMPIPDFICCLLLAWARSLWVSIILVADTCGLLSVRYYFLFPFISAFIAF